jgi:uncharacterized circularly permuted ATP-grasp superfamily protein/uncharacterized alpha-E superfamily protein
LPQTTLPFDAATDAAALAARFSVAGRAGHYDELRDERGGLRPHWQEFFARLGADGFADLDRRRKLVERQIREDRISYNVYSDTGGPERPWSLELPPFIIRADEWAQIEAGIAQRAELLARILQDVYGPQSLLRDGLLPVALVHGHPGYLRPLVGVEPPSGTHLFIASFDLARALDGSWWVVSQRTQAPSGLGYVLQNRLIVSRLFPDAFRDMRVQRLATSYRRLLDALLRASRELCSGSPRFVLLTPGPFNETYFEHVYLARYLGIPLVEGSDLTVRGGQVHLKTLHGLERVHAILRRLDDDYSDPLELRADSTLGVPGLLGAVRAGQVVVANALGSGFLESPALNGFLPAISQRLLGSEPSLPSLDSWWCGERAAWEQVAGRLREVVIKPTYPAGHGRPSGEARIGTELDEEREAGLRAQIEADPDAFTVQSYLPLSQAPAWKRGLLVPRASMVRIYAIADGQGGWHVMPGGLARIAGRSREVVSIQRGGSSLDTWVLTDGAVDSFSMLPEPLRPEDLARHRVVTSRAAENLFWMGRYAERAEFGVRLVRSVLPLLAHDARLPDALLRAMGELCLHHGLVPQGVPSPLQSLKVFERTLIDALSAEARQGGIPFALQALSGAGRQVRDRLGDDHWRGIAGAGERFANSAQRAHRSGSLRIDHAHAALAQLALELAAITGAQTDRMTRDDGWRLLTIGRQIERLANSSGALRVMFAADAVACDDGFDLLLELFDSRLTFRSTYQRRNEIPPLLDLLVQDRANPRSAACAVEVIRGELARLAGEDGSAQLARALALESWPQLEVLCARDGEGRYAALLDWMARAELGAGALSDALEQRHFAQVSDAFHSVRG